MTFRLDPAWKKVLLVEDNSLTLLLLETQFQKLGFHVTKASDGKAGFEACQSESFDLLLIDLNIPLINGKELISRIQNNGTLKQGPAYAMSAGLSQQDIDTLTRMGFSGYLQKPVKLSMKGNHLILEGQ